MITVLIVLGYATAALNFVLFWKTNKIAWLGWTIVQLFLTNILANLQSMI